MIYELMQWFFTATVFAYALFAHAALKGRVWDLDRSNEVLIFELEKQRQKVIGLEAMLAHVSTPATDPRK